MSTSKTIKKEELEKVQELNGKLGQIKSALGDAYIVKKQVSAQQETLMEDWAKAQEELKVMGDELKETYGDVSINIDTGEISEAPATPKKEVEDDNQGNT
tara:strand:- start:1537 stop:1836 length:300 start_codon:yes stop_codon:yes gene_type:complete